MSQQFYDQSFFGMETKHYKQTLDTTICDIKEDKESKVMK
jgi:hypothetical protein